jgi:hypothetical protein
MRAIYSAASQIGATIRDGATPLQSANAVKLLDEILSHSHALTQDAASVHHPLLRENLHDFMQEVRLARKAAAEAPPKLVLAASISGACLYCHALKDCPLNEGICVDVPKPSGP